jgi:hypothetical protein
MRWMARDFDPRATVGFQRRVPQQVEPLAKKKFEGVCKLTGRHGPFVSAHLIPKALTKPEASGLPFIESWSGTRPTRKWSSWYDNRLVTAEGEAVLAALDSWAIAQLRKHKLVWSGWGPAQLLTDNHDRMGDTGFGVRKITGLDGKRLRLFFLSLLWRAAASTHHGFSDIKLSSEEVEKLGQMLLANDPEPSTYFSIQLTQISTLGTVQNLTPFAQTKTIPAFDSVPARTVRFFRFYFDGLVAHIHPVPDGDSCKLGSLVLGLEDVLTVSTVTYEISFQRKNLTNMMAEAYANWPDTMKKL